MDKNDELKRKYIRISEFGEFRLLKQAKGYSENEFIHAE